MGLSHQAVIFAAYLFGTIAIAWWLQKSKKLTKNNFEFVFTKKPLIITALTYLATIPTMVATQLLLLYRVIFKPTTVFDQLSNAVVSASAAVAGIFKNYLDVLVNTYIPTKPVISIIFFMIIVWFVIAKLKSSYKSFFLLILLSPLLLTSWHYRNSYHTLIGIAPILYVFSEQLLFHIEGKLYLGTLITLGIVVIFVTSNVQQLIYSNTTGWHPAAIQTGTNLKNQLSAVNHTYNQADRQPFTISSFTPPFDYNATWSYLYSWYGQEKYNYIPKFVGPDQNGIFGDNALQGASAPNQTHFTIYEPNQGISDYLLHDFVAK